MGKFEPLLELWNWEGRNEELIESRATDRRQYEEKFNFFFLDGLWTIMRLVLELG